MTLDNFGSYPRALNLLALGCALAALISRPLLPMLPLLPLPFCYCELKYLFVVAPARSEKFWWVSYLLRSDEALCIQHTPCVSLPMTTLAVCIIKHSRCRSISTDSLPVPTLRCLGPRFDFIWKCECNNGFIFSSLAPRCGIQILAAPLTCSPRMIYAAMQCRSRATATAIARVGVGVEVGVQQKSLEYVKN